MKLGVKFSAAARRADWPDVEAEEEVGKGRPFVEQDKGPAARYGIFKRLLNERAAFSDGDR